ncbi:MAG: hypothetical protein WC465_02625 [Patescibacteria group bacterium]
MFGQGLFLDLVANYSSYGLFILGALVISLILYFIVGSLLELIYDSLVKHNVDNSNIYAIFLNSFVGLGFLYIIRTWGDWIMQRQEVKPTVILFLSLAWCLSIVTINEKFTSTEKFQLIVMFACLFGFLVWWLWGWLPALYMWALVTFFFYIREKHK